jgi:predicted alpha/beta superfamily hydrolase
MRNQRSVYPFSRHLRPFLLCVCLVCGCTRACTDDESIRLAHGPFPRYSIPNTEVRRLPRSANGRSYQLLVALPDAYDEEPERRYPVLYLCDGYWDLPLVKGITSGLVGDRAIPEVIIVGLDYAEDAPNYGRLRRWDLTPTPATYEGAMMDGPSGHAQEFLAVIEQEIIPLVERDYRAEPSFRVLMGSSLGGLFTLYAMLARPGLFAGYVAVSPAAQWANDWLLGFEEDFHKRGRPLATRLFMSGAEDEVPMILEGVKRFDARLRQRASAELRYELRLIEGERHGGTKAEGYNRGLRFALAPRAPDPTYP